MTVKVQIELEVDNLCPVWNTSSVKMTENDVQNVNEDINPNYVEWINKNYTRS